MAKRQRLSLDLPTCVKKQIQRIAKEENRTITEIIRRAVDWYDTRTWEQARQPKSEATAELQASGRI